MASVSDSPVFQSVSSGSYEMCTFQKRYIYIKVIFVLSLTVGQRGHNGKINVLKDFISYISLLEAFRCRIEAVKPWIIIIF